MGSSLIDGASSRHRLFSEIPPSQMAKADLKKLETGLKALIGQAVERARKSIGWSQKELADAMDKATGAKEPRDPAQLSRWEKGTERPQFDQLWAVPEMRGPLVVSLAALSDSIEVVTEIRVRRSA